MPIEFPLNLVVITGFVCQVPQVPEFLTQEHWNLDKPYSLQLTSNIAEPKYCKQNSVQLTASFFFFFLIYIEASWVIWSSNTFYKFTALTSWIPGRHFVSSSSGALLQIKRRVWNPEALVVMHKFLAHVWAFMMKAALEKAQRMFSLFAGSLRAGAILSSYYVFSWHRGKTHLLNCWTETAVYSVSERGRDFI